MATYKEVKKPPFFSGDSSHIHLLLLGSMLVLFGIMMIYSSSAIYAERLKYGEFYFIARHLIHVALGVLLFLMAAALDYKNLRKFSQILMFISFLLLVLVLVPFIGLKVYGARRWISLYFISFQPAEVFKLSALIWMADFLCRKKEHIGRFTRSLLPLILILCIYLLLLMMQPDYGTAVLLSMTLLMVTLVAGIPFLNLVIVLSGALAAFAYLAIESAYRFRRIQAFLDPWADSSGSGYQLSNSLIAYGGGGLFGRGFGLSVQKKLYLPQAHTDFIAAIIGEEIGLVGFSIFLFVLTLFFMVGFNIASQAKDAFGRYLACGITLLMALQSLFHIFVTLGLLPTKGIGMPFISYGGSLTLISFIMLGILYSISVRNKNTPKKHLNH